MENRFSIKILEDCEIRVDKYISENLKLCPRSQIKNRVTDLKINEKKAKFSNILLSNNLLQFTLNSIEKNEIKAEKMNINILYEDQHTLILDKPQGMVVHPALGNYSDTLVNKLIDYIDVSNFENIERPGIVHRLDKDTSGVILVAKNQDALDFYSKKFFDRKVEKEYRAILKGSSYNESFFIDDNIVRSKRNRKKFEITKEGSLGKVAITNIDVLNRFEEYLYVALFPKTGRTHQLRVHTTSINLPILGDPIYSRRDKNFPNVNLMLHSYKLTIKLYGINEEKTFISELPKRFTEVLDILMHKI